MTISEYFIRAIGDEMFFKEHGKTDKTKGYVRSLRNLRDIYDPADLGNYPDIPVTSEGQQKDRFMTQNHVQGIKHFFTFIKKYHGMDSFNGWKITQWEQFYPNMNEQIGKNRSKEISMSGRNKDITTEDVKEWFEFISPEMRAWYLLLLYSGARGTHLYAALSDPNKKIERLGAGKGNSKFAKLPHEVIFVDATGTAEGKKLEFGFMFPVELEDVVRNYLPPYTSAATRNSKLTSPLGKNTPKDRVIVGAANSRKWFANALVVIDKITEKEIDNLQGRGLGDVRDTNYLETKFKVCRAYSECVEDMLKGFPIPADILKGDYHLETVKKPAVVGKGKFAPLDAKVKKEIISLYKSGMSERNVAEHTGTTRNTISNVLIEAGLKSGKVR